MFSDAGARISYKFNERKKLAKDLLMTIGIHLLSQIKIEYLFEETIHLKRLKND